MRRPATQFSLDYKQQHLGLSHVCPRDQPRPAKKNCGSALLTFPMLYAGASVIVIFNQRDFPAKVLASFGVESQHPDPSVDMVEVIALPIPALRHLGSS